jgi:hypothetical protein
MGADVPHLPDRRSLPHPSDHLVSGLIEPNQLR